MSYTTHYDVLGVRPTASGQQIRRAYRMQVKQHHPDLNRESNAPERFKRLREAYLTLNDPVRRRAYDFWLYEQAGWSANERPFGADGTSQNPRSGTAGGHAAASQDSSVSARDRSLAVAEWVYYDSEHSFNSKVRSRRKIWPGYPRQRDRIHAYLQRMTRYALVSTAGTWLVVAVAAAIMIPRWRFTQYVIDVTGPQFAMTLLLLICAVTLGWCAIWTALAGALDGLGSIRRRSVFGYVAGFGGSMTAIALAVCLVAWRW